MANPKVWGRKGGQSKGKGKKGGHKERNLVQSQLQMTMSEDYDAEDQANWYQEDWNRGYDGI
eukprot:3080865-Prorocentrum_lima.AAC.1